MRKSWKGALLSGLVFPGVGQLWLKLYVRGIALILAVSASSAVIVMKSAQHALAILEKMETEGGAVDMVAILHSTTNASPLAGDLTTKSASMALVVCWVIGVVDAYVMGRKRDLDEQSKARRGK